MKRKREGATSWDKINDKCVLKKLKVISLCVECSANL